MIDKHLILLITFVTTNNVLQMNNLFNFENYNIHILILEGRYNSKQVDAIFLPFISLFGEFVHHETFLGGR
jgi:hypothetical protein